MYIAIKRDKTVEKPKGKNRKKKKECVKKERYLVRRLEKHEIKIWWKDEGIVA